MTNFTENTISNEADQAVAIESNVEQAVDQAERSLSLAYQVRRHPWLCFTGAVGIGFVLSRANQGRRTGPASASVAGLAQSGALLAVGKFFEREIRDLRGYALKQALQVAQGVVEGQVSDSLRPRVGQIFERAAQRLSS